MSRTLNPIARRWFVPSLLLMVAYVVQLEPAQAQFFNRGAVGGVKIDANGVVSNPQVGELKQLQATWQRGLAEVRADLEKFTEMRFVSLKRLESQIAAAEAKGEPLPDAVQVLAGLERVKFVLIYPEEKDIVLAGPAEGWRIDRLGNVVGKSTGRPVLLLDDLLVALRVAESSNRTGISCSIDPTPEGLARMQAISGQLSARGGPQNAARQMEEAVGDQTIKITGVPDTSHLARVIVAADFRMKRLGMNMEQAPVDGLPSFLTMVGRSRGASGSLMPRWWLAADYEPIRRDEAGLAWELRGQGVKCETEQDFLNSEGDLKHSGKADPLAKKWADNFTAKFDELAREDSAFGALRNVMDLSVVAALLVKENLLEKSGLEAPRLLSQQPVEQLPVPRRVPSQASFVKAGRGWIVSVSGGVQIFPWQVADRTEVSSELASTRDQKPTQSDGWYWQR